MTEAQRLWDYYSQKMWNEHSTWDVMDEEAFNKAISDYNPWITNRGPTREDANASEEVWVLSGGFVLSRFYMLVQSGTPWMKIIKPKI